MTYDRQRAADEALGCACRALADRAAQLGLIVKKQCNETGTWTVSAHRLGNPPVWSTGATELDAIEKVLDKLNRVDLAAV